MTPMARTAPWSVAVNETCRAALMADPAWNGRHFTAMPERGLAAWSGVLRLLANSSPAALAGVAKDAAATYARFGILAKDTLAMGIDPLDWIYQSHAYDAHDVAPGGELAAALARITARTLVIASPLDLYNPAAAAAEAASLIAGAQYLELDSVQGHQAATAGSPADVAAIDAAMRAFLR
jgi:homoserine O-acetyltransferase